MVYAVTLNKYSYRMLYSHILFIAAGSAQTQNANAPAVNAATGASNVAATADGATAQGPAAETATETAPEVGTCLLCFNNHSIYLFDYLRTRDSVAMITSRKMKRRRQCKRVEMNLFRHEEYVFSTIVCQNAFYFCRYIGILFGSTFTCVYV
jgi:hypothetical protein